MKNGKLFVLLSLLTFPALEGIGQTGFQLKTGDFALYLRNDKDGLQYKAGLESQVKNDTTWYSFNFGNVEDKNLSPRDFTVTDIQESSRGDVRTIHYQLKHRLLPLQISGRFNAYGQTGVLEQSSELRNTGAYPFRVSEMPSGSFSFPHQEYEYSYMLSKWSRERKLQTKKLNNDTLFVSKQGNSSAVYSPWVCLHSPEDGIHYIAQLAWSGNWSASVLKQPATIRMGEYFDNGFLMLMPGKTHELPSILISGGASMDEAAKHLHHYQRDYLIPKQPAGLFMPVQFNHWFALEGTVSAEKLKSYIAKTADIGCEIFVIDAGWYGQDWNTQVGDWYANPEKFPKGPVEIADEVRKHGMKFGIWFEFEALGSASETLKLHPEWCLQYNGTAIQGNNRAHVDFSNPQAFQWTLEQFDRIYRECGGLDWVKLDHNMGAGSRLENENGIKTGDRLHRHLKSYYAWLDTLHTRYPGMMIEGCAGGGLRLDPGIAAHTHTTWFSDEIAPEPSIALAWGATLEYIPRALNHWIAGKGISNTLFDPKWSAGYVDYMLKVAMNGQFGFSTKITDWTPEQIKCAKKNVLLYKRIRHVIADADCYHLTPQPDYDDPTGWTVLQYVTPDKRKSVVTAYRTRSSEPTFTAILKGLDLKRKYKVFVDGVSKGVYTGSALMKSGLTITLSDEYRASVVEIN